MSMSNSLSNKCNITNGLPVKTISLDSHGNAVHKNTEVSLDSLLDCLPLVYNPTTKSIHISSSNNCSSKSTISNGSIIPKESQDISKKLLRLDEIGKNEEIDTYCNSLLNKDNDRTNNIDDSECSNTELSSASVRNNDFFSSVNEANIEESNIPKSKGGLSFLTDFLVRKNNDSVGASVHTAINSEGSNSCYSWKLFSRSNGIQKNAKSEVNAGSIGLIMEKRPSNLPAKNMEEEENHMKQHHEIVCASKKKEVKEAKEKNKLKVIKLKHEQQLSAAVLTWKNYILPHWDVMKSNKRTLDLWWHGIPSCVRGDVWKLTISNDLNMSPALFRILIKRSEAQLGFLGKEKNCETNSTVCAKNFVIPGDHEATIEFIKLDVSRTFPHIGIFKKGGPMHDAVQNILSAYVCYRPDVGYVQGMSFLSAMLLLNLTEEDGFVAFANLVSRSPLVEFFSMDQISMEAYYNTFRDMLAQWMPALFDHFDRLKVTPDMYLLDWILSLFSRSLPLDVASRLWDIYLRDGQVFIFKAGLGILKLYETTLLSQECTVLCAQFLTRLREDVDSEELFKAIASIQATVSDAWFDQRLHFNLALCNQSDNRTQS